jgi:hypothetical protein
MDVHITWILYQRLGELPHLSSSFYIQIPTHSSLAQQTTNNKQQQQKIQQQILKMQQQQQQKL